jgi:hypothetical protein
MKLLTWLYILLLASWAYAQKGIPNRYMNDPAVDLTSNGQLLFPDEVHQLIEKTKGRFDISTLDPVQTSDLWKNIFPKELPASLISVQAMDEVHYHSPVLSPSGIFRFNIHHKQGNGHLYTVMLSKSVHGHLMAKSLLQKIGYQVPDIKYLSKLVVKFKNENEKKLFIAYLEEMAMAGKAHSWVVEDFGTEIILQDIVVMEANHVIYNLAVGVSADMIQGRRLLSSLAVPLSIVNLPESINKLRWNAGNLSNNQVFLHHDSLDDFQCTWEDARWISRRIEKLSRQDWEAIVEASHLPKPIQQVLVEKLISRRNSVMKLFNIDAKNMAVESKVNNGIDIVNGKVTTGQWPGYANNFAEGDPDSPLADSELKSWIKSRALSTGMDIALAQINQLPFMGTDISKINNEKFQAHLTEAIQKSILEKKPVELPIKSWIFPTARGQLILSRNLITGTYLGTDNLVQLVDTVGVSLGAGVFGATMGVGFTGTRGFTPIGIMANAEASFIRTYAHLRPVYKITKALKYPFKNIFVPLVKVDYSRKLYEATRLIMDPDASEEERVAEINSVLKPFKDALEIGESLIVTDMLATYAAAQGNINLYGKLVSSSLGIVPGHQVISRFHIFRRSEDEFQIYKDIGHKGSVGVHFNLDSLVPVVTLSAKKTDGKARVKFFSLNLNAKNPNVVTHASLLRKAILHSSTAEMEASDIRPYVIKHEFKESTPQANFLFWRYIYQKSSNQISIANPQGDERYYRRYFLGQTKGRNYQAYVNDLITHWVGLIFERKAGLTDATGTNPGFSFKGQAKTRFLTMDQQVDERGRVIEPFVRVTRIWNGWSIDRKRAEEILDEIRTRYRHDFYPAPVLNHTNKIFLYNISVNTFLYKNGLEYLLTLTEEEIRRIFHKHLAQKTLIITPASVDDVDTGVNKFLNFLNNYRISAQRDKDHKSNNYLLKAVSLAERKLTLKGLAELMGGEDNLYAVSRIDGFREADEEGNKPIISDSLGFFGSPRTLGPVVQMQRQTDMLEGEFFIYWMMQRLI